MSLQLSLRLSHIESFHIADQFNRSTLRTWMKLKAGLINHTTRQDWAFVGRTRAEQEAQALTLGISRKTLLRQVEQLVDIGALRPIKKHSGCYHKLGMAKLARHLVSEFGAPSPRAQGRAEKPTALQEDQATNKWFRRKSISYMRLDRTALESATAFDAAILLVNLHKNIEAQLFNERKKIDKSKNGKVKDNDGSTTPVAIIKGLHQKGKGKEMSMPLIQSLADMSMYGTRRAIDHLVDTGRVIKHRRRIRSGEGLETEHYARMKARELGWKGGAFYQCANECWGANFTSIFEVRIPPRKSGKIGLSSPIADIPPVWSYDQKRNPSQPDRPPKSQELSFSDKYLHQLARECYAEDDPNPLTESEIRELYPDYFDDSESLAHAHTRDNLIIRVPVRNSSGLDFVYQASKPYTSLLLAERDEVVLPSRFTENVEEGQGEASTALPPMAHAPLRSHGLTNQRRTQP